MKHYRYRKTTPEMESKMRKLREGGMTYRDIGKMLGVNDSTVIYHLNPEQRIKSIERATKSNSKLSVEERKRINRIRQPYKNKYFKDRYHNDPEFRKRLISQIVSWQKKKRAEKNDNKKN